MSFDDDEPAPRVRWFREHLTWLDGIPGPGRGATVHRWPTLADLPTADGSLARLGVEPSPCPTARAAP